MKKYHYTYRLIAENPIDERVEYIGVRSCDCLPEEDSAYHGSSRHLPRSITYRKEIIALWPTRKEAVAHEVALHELHNVAKNPRFFNKAKQTCTGFDTAGIKLGSEFADKVSKASRLRHTDLEFKKRHSNSLVKAFSTPEAKAKLSAAAKLSLSRPEVREKISAAGKIAQARPSVKKAVSEASKARWGNSEYRERVIEKQNAVRADPIIKERHKSGIKKAFLSGDVQKKMSETRKQLFIADAGLREKVGKDSKARWSDPAYKARVSAAIKKSWEKRSKQSAS